MLPKTSLILILLFGSLTCEEVSVSDDEDYEIELEEINNSENGNHRSGKLLWSYHPMIDVIVKSGGSGFINKNNGEFFDFIRDSYPLPGGLTSPLAEYDFIIVGAGSAGSALASRLTENRNVTVLLVEKSYREVLEYYKKSERANLNGLEYSPYRGLTGELNVEHVPFRTPLIDVFLAAGRQLGYPTMDYNSPEQLGFGYMQATMRNGRRLSAAKAFLHNNKNRPNLHILPMTVVSKVLIDPTTRATYGVQYIRNRLQFEVRAKREVILSAGPIASPQILMLSGIGPKQHLRRHGIPLIQDLPVGRTLYDHITFPGLVFTLNVTNVSLIESRETNFNNVLRWLQFGDGPPSTTGAAEGIGYIKTYVSDDPDPVPDIELISIGGSIVSDGGGGGSKAVRRGMMIREDLFDAAYGPVDATDTWGAFPMLLHPKSVGYLELKDNNPFSHPRMYGNYLTDPSDIATFVAAIRFIQALTETQPFQELGARIHRANYLTCQGMTFDSDEYWECAVRTLTATLHHQIGTCRMGPNTDPEAVVDPELRVYGVSRLRVVDSSVLPRTLSVHTNAPAIMIGEKAADMIKAAWN